MSKSIFAATVLACLAGLGALAMNSRPAGNQASDKQALTGPTIETTVAVHTKRVTRHVHRKASASKSGPSKSTTSVHETTAVQPPPAVANENEAEVEHGAENEVEHGAEQEAEHRGNDSSDDSGHDGGSGSEQADD